MIKQENSKNTEKPKQKKGFANENQKKNINKNGRPPKDECLTDILREYLSQPEKGSKKERRQQLVEKIYKMAMEDGDLGAIKQIWDRIEGKPREKKEVDVKADVNVVYADPDDKDL